MTHITGGGLPDNVVRILPDNCRAVIETGSWQTPVIFGYLQERGGTCRGNVPRFQYGDWFSYHCFTN